MTNVEANDNSKAPDPNWSLDQDICQTSYSSCSSSTSIQSIQGEDTNEHVIEEHDYYLVDEEANNHETEVSHDFEDDPATICVPKMWIEPMMAYLLMKPSMSCPFWQPMQQLSI